MPADQGLQAVLDLARWAPSGDNTQPWRFERVNEHHVVVHGFDTREHCVYDLDGHASELSLGALLETLSIAASAQGWAMNFNRRGDTPVGRPVFDVHFSPDAQVRRSELVESITLRSVQRRPMSTRRLTSQEKQALEDAVSSYGRVVWLEEFGRRLKMARLLSAFARLRLTMPEAYRVHRDIIEWNARYSIDKVPDQALGVDRMTLRLMRFVMADWQRVRFFNRFLAGTWVPRVQMDVIPGLACAAHFLLVAPRKPESIDDFVTAGRAMQRFWLTATRLKLVLQPEMTPLIFTRYVRETRSFTTTAPIEAEAKRLGHRLHALLGKDNVQAAFFMGRVGAGPVAASRSTRLPLQRLRAGDGSS